MIIIFVTYSWDWKGRREADAVASFRGWYCSLISRLISSKFPRRKCTIPYYGCTGWYTCFIQGNMCDKPTFCCIVYLCYLWFNMLSVSFCLSWSQFNETEYMWWTCNHMKVLVPTNVSYITQSACIVQFMNLKLNCHLFWMVDLKSIHTKK